MVDCCEEMARYYRALISLDTPSIQLQPPRHGSHITVIAGKYEAFHNNHVWKKHDGKRVTFYYTPNIQSDGVYHWLPVVCKEFEYVRMELGLSRTIPIPWHLTIGNLK